MKERRARRVATTVPGELAGGAGIGVWIETVATDARAKERGWIFKDENPGEMVAGRGVSRAVVPAVDVESDVTDVGGAKTARGSVFEDALVKWVDVS